MRIKLLIMLMIIAADQAVKHWAVVNLAQTGFRPEIPGVIGLTYVENRGAAFGIFQNMRWLFVAFTAAVVLVILFMLFTRKIKEPLGAWSLVFIASGAVGNLIDRALNGYVVDMFDFRFMSFAVFNVADVFVTTGAALFCLYVLFTPEKNTKKKAGSSHDDTAGV